MSTSQMPQMFQVYAVIGGIDYEGEDFDTLKLFDCKSSAEAYYQQLTEVDGFDYAYIEVKTVNLQSAIAS